MVKCKDLEPPTGYFSYRSVVVMILYFDVNLRPDVAYTVGCGARYMFSPEYSHELAIKKIGWYLKATRDIGLVLNPFP